MGFVRLTMKFLPGINGQGQITLRYFYLYIFFFISGFFPVVSLDLAPYSDSGYCKAPSTGNTMTEEAKPKLIVFDLDYTLWPFWVDTHVDPPFTLNSDNKVHDSRGAKVKYYPEVPEVLKQLHSDGYKLGIASRTGAIEDGEELVKLFDWKQFFHFSEIYPGMKTAHFSRFHEKSQIPFEDMLFFDDENRNIVDVSKLGVTCILVKNGVSHKVVQEGLERFSKNKAKGKC